MKKQFLFATLLIVLSTSASDKEIHNTQPQRSNTGLNYLWNEFKTNSDFRGYVILGASVISISYVAAYMIKKAEESSHS